MGVKCIEYLGTNGCYNTEAWMGHLSVAYGHAIAAIMISDENLIGKTGREMIPIFQEKISQLFKPDGLGCSPENVMALATIYQTITRDPGGHFVRV